MPLELRGERRDDTLGRRPIAGGATAEHMGDRCFNGAATQMIDACPASRQPQLRPSPIRDRGRAFDEALVDEALQHTRQRAGVKVQDMREIAGGQSGEQPDDA